jgi:hypothetical protein
VDATGWLGLVVAVVALELLELLEALGLLGLLEALEALEALEGEDAPEELFVTAEVAGAVGLWLAPPDGVLPLVEGCPDRAKARAAPPAPSKMATARTRVSRTGRRMPVCRGVSGGRVSGGRVSGGRVSGGRVSGGGAPRDGVLHDEAARDGVEGSGPAGCQVWASTV